MGEVRRSYEQFTEKLRGAVQRMAEDGIPRDQVQEFIDRKKSEWSAAENAGRAQRLDAAESETSAGNVISGGVSQWGSDWKDRLVAMARGGKKLGEMASSPGESYRLLRDVPEARRELGRGLSDSLMGAPAWLGDKAGITGYKQTAEHDAAMAEQDPRLKNVRGAGGIAGTAAMAPFAGLGSAKALATLPRSLVAPATLAAGPIAAAGTGAAQAAFDPAGHVLPRTNPKDGTIDPGGLVGGATDPTALGLPLMIRAAQGASNLLRKNPTIGRYARAKESGALERPDMKALPKGQEGMQAAAEQGLDRIVNRDRQLAQQASEAYHRSVEPELGRPVDTEALRMRLLEGRQGNIDPDSGLPIRPEVDAAYNRAFDNTPEAATVRGTLMRRRGLQQDANFGSQSPTEGQLAQRDVYQTFRQAVRDASPGVAAADDAYSAAARQGARRSDILFNTEENVIPSGGGGGFPDARPVDVDPARPMGAAAALDDAPDMRVSKARSAATTLSRIDDENLPGLRAARFLEELAGQDPAFRQALDFIANKKAQEGTRFGLPQLPTNLTGATSFAGKLPFAQQNMRALGARVLDPAAKNVGNIGPGTLVLNPIVRAYQAQQEREAEALRRRGR